MRRSHCIGSMPRAAARFSRRGGTHAARRHRNPRQAGNHDAESAREGNRFGAESNERGTCQEAAIPGGAHRSDAVPGADARDLARGSEQNRDEVRQPEPHTAHSRVTRRSAYQESARRRDRRPPGRRWHAPPTGCPTVRRGDRRRTVRQPSSAGRRRTQDAAKPALVPRERRRYTALQSPIDPSASSASNAIARARLTAPWGEQSSARRRSSQRSAAAVDAWPRRQSHPGRSWRTNTCANGSTPRCRASAQAPAPARPPTLHMP